MEWFEFNNEIPLNTIRTWREIILSTASFEFKGWSGLSKEPFRHWVAYPDTETTQVYTSIFECLNESALEVGLRIAPERFIVNLYNHGDSSWLHRDTLSTKAYTIILFLNDYWDNNWGGDFIIANEHEILKATFPTPGKFLIFKSNLLHGARPVSREAPFPRMGLAIQCIEQRKT